MPVVAFGMPGPTELGVILLIVIMLFGVGKLPSVMGDMGRGIRSLRDAATGGGDDEEGSATPTRRQITKKKD